MSDKKRARTSTTQVAATRFRAHGRVDMWMEASTLMYEATGPFNEEVFELLAVAQMDVLAKLSINGPWASICTVRNSAMCTPQGLQRYTELMQAPKPRQMEPVATAFVMGPEVEGGRLMTPHFASIYASINRPFQTFETMADAQAWTQSVIASWRHTG